MAQKMAQKSQKSANAPSPPVYLAAQSTNYQAMEAGDIRTVNLLQKTVFQCFSVSGFH